MLVFMDSLVWFKLLFILLQLFTYSTATEISYLDHCSSVVPESSITDAELVSLPFCPLQTGYHDGGDRLRNLTYQVDGSYVYSSNTLLFQTQHVFRTETKSVFKVVGTLELNVQNLHYLKRDMAYSGSFYQPKRSRDGGLSFNLEGFWSENSGEMCMVGSGSGYSTEGKLLHLNVVLQLSGVKNSSTVTSLVTGTLKSLNEPKGLFEPISLLMFTQTNYQYSKVSDFTKECSGCTDVRESSLSLHVARPICSVLSYPYRTFQLEYSSDCDSKGCNLLGDEAGFLPQIMSLNNIQCSQDGHSARVLVEFTNTSYFGYYYGLNPNTTLVAEGRWDARKSMMFLVVCQFLNRNSSLSRAQIGDCSTRMNLWFPAVWSIRNSTSIRGEIWSDKPANDTGYFNRITFRSAENSIVGVPGLKYEYTETSKVTKECSFKKSVQKGGNNYPDADSRDMRFDMEVKKNSRRRIGWGFADPISVGDDIVAQSSRSGVVWSSNPKPKVSAIESITSNRRPLNISYKISLTPGYSPHKISLFNFSSDVYRPIEILAEGLYDAETGSLCMVGCRYVGLSNQTVKADSMDCEIRVNVQFPSQDAQMEDAYITGSISTTRNKSDPLYFEPVSISSRAFYTTLERGSIWRMDMEILMVLISNTLACIFIVFQILYAKRQPGVLPYISLLMVVVLTVGHMMLLLLNFEALFSQTQDQSAMFLRSGGWLEAPEVIVRIATMLAFLLQFRLLQLSWSSRVSNEKSQKASWNAEKKAWYVSLPLYLTGALISVFTSMDKTKKAISTGMLSPRYASSQYQWMVWGSLRSYGGLILDGFLFPQILLNIFLNSSQKALSPVFYIGYTLIRLAPHAYDLYRAHNYIVDFDESYIYADHRADFYSTAWNVCIPLGCILFAAVIYFQQRFGGRCFLPRRFREVEGYEQVPAVAADEQVPAVAADE